MYEKKFRRVESALRPRSSIKHQEAIDVLATVVKEADKEVLILKHLNIQYRNWLILSTMVIGLMGIALWL